MTAVEMAEANPDINHKVQNRCIYLFVPNIIGYIRILLLMISSRLLYLEFYLQGTFIYMLSVILDYIDGYFARKLNQCTAFGGLFDPMIDSLGDAVMLIHIAMRYPSYLNLIQLYIVVDLGCEWLSTSAHCTSGSLSMKCSTWAILKFYYNTLVDYTWFSYNCFLSGVYISSYTMGPMVPLLSVQLVPLIMLIVCPFAMTRFIFMFIKIYESLSLYQDISMKRQLEKLS